ncbi:MAG: hypothetical protein JWQ89_2060 [Devosia sp.]|uniref:hypothetical protein n=1 Tax=Devosia sp. TaxID=1871048 RepID=UPI00262F3342|nr:hypothetical protein [Devosia sp.]MDB5540333.1 hypothetical protein [Devosia sp.]
MKIKGLDNLTNKLSDAGKAFDGVDDLIATVAIDKADGGLSAITEMEKAIDTLIRRYPGNAMVKATGEGLKEAYAQAIRAKAKALAEGRSG